MGGEVVENPSIEQARQEQRAAARKRAQEASQRLEKERSERYDAKARAARRAADAKEEALADVCAPSSARVYSAGLEAAMTTIHGQVRVPRTPEYVLAGPRGHGRTSLLSFVVGEPHLAQMGASRRVVQYRLVRGSGARKVVLEQDVAAGQYQVELSASQWVGEIRRRAEERSDSPLIVRVESAEHVLESVWLDLPGYSESPTDEERRLTAQYAGEATSSHRRIVWVEELTESAGELSAMRELPLLDAALLRSTVVLTHGHSVLQHVQQRSGDLPALMEAFQGWTVPSFVVTLPSVAQALQGPGVFQSLDERDHALVATMVPEAHVRWGLLRFRRHIHESMAYHLLDQIPSLYPHPIHTMEKIKPKAAVVEEEEKKKKNHPPKTTNQHDHEGGQAEAEQVARRYVVAYVGKLTQRVGELIDGSVAGNAAVLGQTRAEELEDQGDLIWSDGRGSALDEEAMGELAFEGTRLVGGPQFDRLMAEFRAIAAVMDIDSDEISVDELMSAIGLRRLPNGAPDFLWVACNLAAHRASADLAALLHVLRQRIGYVLERLVRVAEDSLRAEPVLPDLGLRVGDLPFACGYAGEQLRLFLEQAVRQFADEALASRYGTEAVYWHFSQRVDGEKFGKTLDNSMCWKVIRVARDLYRLVREHLVSDTILKAYNLVLLGLQELAEPALLKTLLEIPEKDAETLFHIDALRAREQLARKQRCTVEELADRKEDAARAATESLAHELRQFLYQ